MFGFFKSPGNKVSKQNSVDPPSSGTNPFDSDTESNTKSIIKPSRRANSEPVLIVPSLGSNPYGDEDNGRKGTSSATSSYSNSSTTQDKYRNDFRESGGLENQSMQELENYAVYKAEETTSTVKNCLNIAEDIRGDATRTLDMLHHQGEQIRRTHDVVANTDKDLSKGEKILGNLGGMFSKTWKPKKSHEISGPVVTIENSSKRSDKKQREKLGLAPVPKGKGTSCTPPPEPTNALQKVEVEKAKQDDALSDLSNVLGELKNMAVDMGGELNRQNKALDHLGDDVDELNSRVKGANQRTRRLLGK